METHSIETKYYHSSRRENYGTQRALGHGGIIRTPSPTERRCTKIILADRGWDSREQIANLRPHLRDARIDSSQSEFDIVAAKIHASVKRIQYVALARTNWSKTRTVPTNPSMSGKTKLGHMAWNIFELVGIVAPNQVDKLKKLIQTRRGIN